MYTLCNKFFKFFTRSNKKGLKFSILKKRLYGQNFNMVSDANICLPYEKEVLVSIGSNTSFAKKYMISNTYSRKKY